MINNRNELYDYLNNVDWESKRDTKLSSVYFLVTVDSHTEPIHFMQYENAYFESPCDLHSFPLLEDELEDYVKEVYEEIGTEYSLEFEKTMQRGSLHYDIDCPQCFPFFDKIDNIVMISEKECLDWLIAYDRATEKDESFK